MQNSGDLILHIHLKMRIIAPACILSFVIALSGIATAQDRMNAFNISPFGQWYFMGSMFEYERLINNKHGIAVSYSPVSNITPFTWDIFSKGYYDGSDIGVMYRYRWENNGFDGSWIGFGVSSVSITYDDGMTFKTYFKTKRVNASGIAPKIEYGASFALDNGLFLKVSAAVGYYNLTTEVTGRDGSKAGSNFFSPLPADIFLAAICRRILYLQWAGHFNPSIYLTKKL